MLDRRSPSLLIIALCFCAALAALGTAWTAQYGFGLYPCELCLYQRLPYIGIVAIAGLALVLRIGPDACQQLVFVIACLFLASAGTAFFHVGVELEWWQSSCAPTGPQSFSFDDIQAALQQPGQPACNEVPFTLFGVSMAGYNLLTALVLAAASLWASQQKRFW